MLSMPIMLLYIEVRIVLINIALLIEINFREQLYIQLKANIMIWIFAIFT